MWVILLAWPHDVHSKQWWRVDIADAVIYTDVEQSDASALAEHLVRLGNLAGRLLPATTAPESPAAMPAHQLEVLIFARRRDFAALLKPRHYVAFTRPGLASTMLMVAPAGGGEDSLFRNLQHEYAHYQLRKQKVYLPPWYDEGIASLFEHLQFAADDVAALDTGRLFSRYNAPLRGDARPSFKQLLHTTDFFAWPRPQLQRFYGLSGQLVHFLQYGHEKGFPDRREQLQQFLQDGNRSLTETLGVSVRQLQRDFDRYRRLAGKPAPQWHIPRQNLPQPTLTALPAAAVLRIHARAAEGANPAAAIDRYTRAAALQPEDAELWVDLARAHLGNGASREAEAALQRASALAPDLPSVKLQQAEMMLRNCWLTDSETCYADWQAASDTILAALEQDPDRLEGVYLLGLVDLYRGRADLAANYLWVVYRYAPWVPQVNYHLGECLRLLGDSRAPIYLRNARDWAEEDRWRKAAEASLTRLGKHSRAGR